MTSATGGRTWRQSWRLAAVMSVALATRGTAEQTPTPALRLGEEILVSGGFESADFLEPAIAALPGTPPSFVVAGFQRYAGPGLQSDCVIFVSSDGGSSWARTTAGDFDDSRICVDPWLVVDETGALVFAYLHSFDETPEGFRLGVRVRRSADKGATWSNPISLPMDARSYDKPSLVVDTSATSPYLGHVYVHTAAATRLPTGELVNWIAAFSDYGTGTFASAQRIAEGRLSLNSGNPGVLSDGTLIVPFNEVAGGGRLLEFPRLWVALSEDGGRSFSLPYLVSEKADAYPYTLAVDSSEGAFRDRAYLAFKGREGDSQIYVARSEDRGRTWSEPVRVNDNSNHTAFQLAPMIAVNNQGVVGVAWYDRRSAPNNLCTEVYASVSVDGGQSFHRNVRVSREKSCAPDDGRGPDMQKWNVGGEYAGIAAAADGSFQVVWSDARSGSFQLRT